MSSTGLRLACTRRYFQAIAKFPQRAQGAIERPGVIKSIASKSKRSIELRCNMYHQATGSRRLMGTWGASEADERKSSEHNHVSSSLSSSLLSPRQDQNLLQCPISGEDLHDPVVASDGFTYERANLVDLFRKSSQPRSPLTNQVLDPSVMLPNLAVKALMLKPGPGLDLNPRTMSTVNPLEQEKMGMDRLRTSEVNGRISSDLSELDRLHAKHGWIPNSSQIRPSPATLARKALYFAEVIPQYKSEKDFILHSIFNLPLVKSSNHNQHRNFGSDEEDNKLSVLHPGFVLRPHSLRATRPNMFPYDVPSQTLHFVHWIYPHFDPNVMLDETETNRSIRNQLEAYFGPRTVFEFVWDVNPKMSLPHDRTGCMHIHVFTRVVSTS